MLTMTIISETYHHDPGGVGAHLSHQLMTLDVNNREDCAKKFISNRWDYMFFKIEYENKADNLFSVGSD